MTWTAQVEDRSYWPRVVVEKALVVGLYRAGTGHGHGLDQRGADSQEGEGLVWLELPPGRAGWMVMGSRAATVLC